MGVLPTPRLLGLALGTVVPLLAATFEPSALFVALLYLIGLVLVAVVDARRVPPAKSFRIERQYDQRLSLGEPNPVDLRIHWLGFPSTGVGPPLRLWVRDEAPVQMTIDRRILEGAIAPGGVWSDRYHVHPVRRGDYAFGATTLRIETPLRLLIKQYTFATDAPARVYPNLRAINRYELLIRRGRLHETGLRRARLLGRGTEFERLRDYQPDDDFRRISWPATARRHQPVTVEYETERSQNLIVLIDSGRLMGAPVGQMEKLDYAVNAALMLTYVAVQMGDRAGLLTYSDYVESYVPPSRGRRQFQVLLESLYRVRSQPIESDPGRALAYLATRQTRRSLIVLLTDLAEAADAEPLIAHLGHLARHHLPLCVTISDPDVSHLAAAPPSDSRRAYERVVAQRLLDERRVTLDHLERRGILTLDVPAEQLTTTIINRYLEIKARTQL